MYKISLSLKSTKISSSKSSIFPKPRHFSFQTTQRSKSQISHATFSQIVSKASYSSKIKFNFIEKDGKAVEVEGTVGQNLLDIAHANKVDLEGACEGSLACSTCHVILSPDIYNSLSEPTDEENDMLDLAFGLTQTSRLGCQVLLTKEMEGMNVQLPSATRNMAVDGFKPKPH